MPRSGRGQAFQLRISFWIPAFAGMTTICVCIKVGSGKNKTVL